MSLYEVTKQKGSEIPVEQYDILFAYWSVTKADLDTAKSELEVILRHKAFEYLPEWKKKWFGEAK